MDDGFQFPEDKTNVDGDTPLHHAAENGHLEVVRCLLAAGAEKDKDSGWYFPFVWLPSLVWFGKTMEHGSQFWSGLLFGSVSQHERSQDNNDGLTPLHHAALLGHAGVARCLLEAGADKDRGNFDGGTPMHDAAENGHVQVVRSLLDASANQDNGNCEGVTPLHLAARCHCQT